MPPYKPFIILGLPQMCKQVEGQEARILADNNKAWIKTEVEGTFDSEVGDEETMEANLGWILTVTVGSQVMLSARHCLSP